MKIVLEYDPSTGQITDDVETIVGTWMGLQMHELKEEDKGTSDVIKLVSMGVSADEIIKLKSNDII